MDENLDGAIDWPVNMSKWNNTTNIVIGFDENHGGNCTKIHFVGIKGKFLRTTVKGLAKGMVYESRANIADHPQTETERKNMNNIGM